MPKTTQPYAQHKFLSKEFFANILKKQQCDKGIEVTNLKLEPGLTKGENYASDIIRVTVEYTAGSNNQRCQKYIVKAGLADSNMQDMLEEYDVFHREIVVYDKILPVVHSLMLSIEDKTKLAPSVYSLSKNPRHFVFEDLTLQGFVKADRFKGLNYAETKIFLERLAKFHAATAVLYSLDPDSMKDHHFRNIGPDQPYFYPLFTNSMATCAELAANWKGCEKFAKKLSILEKHVIEKAFDVYTWNEEDFNVLTHGDAWLSNALYKYNANGDPEDCILVDYSIGYFGSPGIDLSYLLFGSTCDEIQEKEFDLLIQDYHTELVSVLTKLGYKKKLPSVIDLQIEVLRKGLIGVMYSMFLIPIRLLIDTEHADLSALLGLTDQSKEFRLKLFSAPGYKQRMTYLLDYYNRKGFIEV